MFRRSQNIWIQFLLLFLIPRSFYYCSLLFVAVYMCALIHVCFDRRRFGRFLGEITASKWEAIFIELVSLGVSPKGQMSRCACSEGHLSSGNMWDHESRQVPKIIRRVEQFYWKHSFLNCRSVCYKHKILHRILSSVPQVLICWHMQLQLSLDSVYTEKNSPWNQFRAVCMRYLVLPTMPFCVHNASSFLHLFTWMPVRIDAFSASLFGTLVLRVDI